MQGRGQPMQLTVRRRVVTIVSVAWGYAKNTESASIFGLLTRGAACFISGFRGTCRKRVIKVLYMQSLRFLYYYTVAYP